MKDMYKLAQGILFVSQLGVSLVTPPLVLVWLAWKAQQRWALGPWIMVLSIVIGLLCSFSSAWNLFAKLTRRRRGERRDPPP